MVIVSFMVLGVVSLGRLGIDLFPEVNFPFVNVQVPYPGAGPEEVETLVTRLTALLEPFLILIMVGIVVVIILATLVPLLNITTSLG